LVPASECVPSTKVLLVDDDDDLRRSTARILSRHGYECVEAGSSSDACVALDAHDDIAAVLCDITMPGESGLDLLAQLTAEFPEVAVVMATGFDDPRIAEVAFERGAFGFVIKPWDTNELLIGLAAALRRRDAELAAHGNRPAQQRANERARMTAAPDIVISLLAPPPTPRRVAHAELTQRELEILELVADGLGNKQIARRLGLSLNTVRNHVRNTLAKLQAHSRLEAVATAVREEIVEYPRTVVPGSS
jgi:DNA-binding NarL/FixJ family response regulator